MKPSPRLALSTLSLLALVSGCAAPVVEEIGPVRKPVEERIPWFRDARFGMFVHWGLFSLPAGEWQGSTDHGESIRTTAEIPRETYQQLLPHFNPTEFDADAWVRAAKDAGMRYIVLTTKHHDGFCLWDSEHTEWDVMRSGLERDVLAEIADACERHDVRLGLYYSIMDWDHDDYLPRREWETARDAEGAEFARYEDYMRAQVAELLSEYGEIDVMWFDGEWESTWDHEKGQALYELCLDLQPDILINNRVDKGRDGMSGLTLDGRYAGDFGTLEQEIPPTGLPGVDWETCMTMNDHWGFNRADGNWKSSDELIRSLVDVASKGGNFLLNVGPTGSGAFPPEAAARLSDIGSWMDRYGESIHGTEAGPFESLPFGRCTMKREGERTLLYLQVFEWPFIDELVVPGIGNEVVRAWIVGDEDAELDVTRRKTDIVVRVPPNAPHPASTPIALEIVGEPSVYDTPRIVAPSTQLVNYVQARIETSSDELDVHYTLNGTDPGVGSPRCTGVVRVDRTCQLRAQAFLDGRAVTPVSSMRFERVLPILPVSPTGVEPGLLREVHAGDWKSIPDFDQLEATGSEPVAAPVLDATLERESVGARFTGFLRVPEDEVYTFGLASDDGSRLWIGGDLVVDNDGLHGAVLETGTAALGAGLHPITLEWFNQVGSAALELSWARLDGELEPVPAAAFSHRPE